MSTFGVIYVAFGPAYLAMALVSAASLRATNPTVPICMITNVAELPAAASWWNSELGDVWLYRHEESGRNRKEKIAVYDTTPFDYTVYLDCDTMVLGPIDPLRKYLEFADIAFKPTYVPLQSYMKIILCNSLRYSEDGHFNGGVFAFRKSRGAEQFFRNWSDRFDSINRPQDQPSLMEAFLLSEAKLFPLAPRWNSGDKWLAHRAVRDDIVIWHYKTRIEPYLARLLIEVSGKLGLSNDNYRRCVRFFQSRSTKPGKVSISWRFRTLATQIRGQLSKRLLRSPYRERWLSCIQYR